MSRVFFWNFVALVLVGVLFSFWMLYYTDLFPVVGGLLALGGLFSWVPFLLNALPPNRVEELQASVDRRILGSNSTAKWCLVILVVGLLLGNCRGTVQVEHTSGTADRMVWAEWAGTTLDPSDRLAPGESLRENVWTMPWEPKELRIKVSGLPAISVRVRPWHRERLHIPSSFLSPVLVVRPSPALMDTVSNSPMKLVIKTRSAERQIDFDGRSILVGCDLDVEVPTHLREKWRDELSTAQASPYLRRWLAPAVPDGIPLRLEAGSRVLLELYRDGTMLIGPEEVVIRPYHRLEDFPQEVVIDVPTS